MEKDEEAQRTRCYYHFYRLFFKKRRINYTMSRWDSKEAVRMVVVLGCRRVAY